MGVPGGGIAGAVRFTEGFCPVRSRWKVKTRTLYRTRKACGTRGEVLRFMPGPSKFRWVRIGELTSRAAPVGRLNHTRAGLQQQDRGTLAHTLFADNRSSS